MDRLSQALRRYQQIVPEAADHGRVPLKKAEVWLTEEVAGALEDITGRPTFRDYAAWPVAALGKHSDAPERQLVEEVDQALRTCAGTLSNLAAKKDLLRRLRDAFPPVQHIAEQSVRIDAHGSRPVAHQRASYDELSHQLSQLEALAGTDQGDLVNVNDYFNPQQEWGITADNEYVQRVDFIRSLNPELLPIGNFIVRCLWKRVSQRQAVIQGVRNRCEVLLRNLTGRYQKEQDALDVAWSAMEDRVGTLRRLLMAGLESQRRDACVAATQVYAAWHANPDMTWLGLDPEIAEQGVHKIRAQLNQRDSVHLLDRIAVSLGELRFLTSNADTRASEFEQAVANGHLVLIVSDQAAYWETLPIQRLPPKAWELFHALARKARLHADAGPNDVGNMDGGLSDTAMSTRWSRLEERLPSSLSRLVRPGTPRASYRLDLEPSRICIFRNRT